MVFAIVESHNGRLPNLCQSITLVNSSPPDKMAVILADDILKCIFLNESDKIPI